MSNANSYAIKSVLSGDTVILANTASTTVPPKELLVHLQHVRAPRFSTTAKHPPSQSPHLPEPWAWEAREWLRRFVGKPARILTSNKVSVNSTTNNNSIQSRVQVMIRNGSETSILDLGEEVVRGGFGKVLVAGSSAVGDDYLQKLQALEQQAKEEQKGQWSADTPILRVTEPFQGDARDFLKDNLGKPLPAFVEQVRDGGVLRLVLLSSLPEDSPVFKTILVQLSGIRVPSGTQSGNHKKDGENEDADANETHDSISSLGDEARWFVESRLLQRNVVVHLEGVAVSGGGGGTNNIFYGSVIHPAGNISEVLVGAGLAKVVEWNAANVTGGADKLRLAEQQARLRKLKLWAGDMPPQSNGGKAGPSVVSPGSKFKATVSRIISCDTIAVTVDGSLNELKVTFSSYRQPRPKDQKEAFWNNEGREYLRQKLIGQQVQISVEYIKPRSDDGYDEKCCATVILGNSMNVAEALIAKGFGSAIRHRKDDEDRSHSYDMLLQAEDRAHKAKKGIWSEGEVQVLRINDASETAAKARSFLSAFKRAGKIPAVVEFIANGGRYKLHLPKEQCKITFVLAGVRVPRIARNPSDKDGEPFGNEAYEFVSRNIYQRDVEIEIVDVDKSGGFIGSLFFRPANSSSSENIAISLIEQGFGSIHGFSANQLPHANQLYSAENKAKAQKKGIWASYVEETPLTQEAADSTAPARVVDVAVSEVVDGGHFYVQILDNGGARLEGMMKELSSHYKSAVSNPPTNLKIGDLVAANSSEDKLWYRARVKRKLLGEKKVEVLYVDYGNSEIIPLSQASVLDPKFKSLPDQAQPAEFSFLRVPNLNEDYGAEAVDYFINLMSGKTLLTASLDYKMGSTNFVTLYERNQHKMSPEASISNSLNAAMLRHGMAQVSAARLPSKFDNIIKLLKNEEAIARRNRLGMFEYGDYEVDEDPNM